MAFTKFNFSPCISSRSCWKKINSIRFRIELQIALPQYNTYIFSPYFRAIDPRKNDAAEWRRHLRRINRSRISRSLTRRIGGILRNLSSPSLVRNFISLSRDKRDELCPRARAAARPRFPKSSSADPPPGESFAAEGSCGFCGSTRGERSLSSAASPDVLQLNPSKAARSVQRLPLPFLCLSPIPFRRATRYPPASRRTSTSCGF